MASEVLFENPPALSGSERNQLEQLYRHLFDLSNKLNEALMTISIDQLTPEAQTTVQKAGEAAQKSEDNYTALKSMIVKNAEVTRLAMDEIRRELQTQYTAISEDFGTFQQTLNAQISETAAGIMQEYHIEERIQGVEEDTSTFINSLSAYIYSGLLSQNPATYGIAIGYNVTNEDGTLNDQNKSATFTADKLSFWLNGQEVAYFSNRIFHIESGEITGELRMGGYIWKTLTGGAMGLMKG